MDKPSEKNFHLLQYKVKQLHKQVLRLQVEHSQLLTRNKIMKAKYHFIFKKAILNLMYHARPATIRKYYHDLLKIGFSKHDLNFYLSKEDHLAYNYLPPKKVNSN